LKEHKKGITFDRRIGPRAFPMAEKYELSSSRQKRGIRDRGGGFSGDGSRDLQNLPMPIALKLGRVLKGRGRQEAGVPRVLHHGPRSISAGK
jgi:hypothetical protein